MPWPGTATGCPLGCCRCGERDQRARPGDCWPPPSPGAPPRVRVLLPGRRRHGTEGLFRNLDYAEAALDGLGLAAAAPRAGAIETDDPFTLAEALAAAAARAAALGARQLPAARHAARGAAAGAGRAACRGRRRRPAEVVAMPALAPFGVARWRGRGLHALPRLHHGLPDRGLLAPIPRRRSCASWRMPACNAGSARRPARSR